jgi:sigma-E factor negative regulatory protein RseA
VTQQQIESQLSASQLSAMFDGELPAAECELLSRRLDRDEKLRGRWSRYALIGAAMRSEPVATAKSGFASRVSAALDAELGIASSSTGRAARGGRLAVSSGRTVWNTALAASMVAAVAGVSIALLRYSSPAGTAATLARADAMTSSPAGGAVGAATAVPVGLRTVTATGTSGTQTEPRSYVTPINQTAAQAASSIGLQTQLADYMVAHSEYSLPLVRRATLSALVSNEEMADQPVARIVGSHAGQSDVMPAAGAGTH